jgi:hypothetical protein
MLWLRLNKDYFYQFTNLLALAKLSVYDFNHKLDAIEFLNPNNKTRLGVNADDD